MIIIWSIDEKWEYQKVSLYSTWKKGIKQILDINQ